MRVSGQARVSFQQRLGASWKDLADYFEIEPHVTARWRQGDEPSELWEYLRNRRRLVELPAALADVGRRDLVAVLPAEIALLQAEPVAPGRRRRRTIALVAAAAALVLAAAGLTVWRWPRDASSAGGVKLQVLPAPAAVTWGAKLTCAARTQWPHSFPPGFVGEVYVQFTADARRRVDVKATLYWGGMTWSQTVPAMPGDMDDRVGGTLLIFDKRSVDHGRPASVSFETDIPVCATFGTASDATRAAPGLTLQTPHWR
ncbi:MAG TPA: hypothetical protein VGD29_03700 [Actinoplanes sp.]